MLKLSFLIAGILWSSVSVAETVKQTFDAKKMKSMTVETSEQDIEVLHTTSKVVSVILEKGKKWKDAVCTFKVTDSGANIEVKADEKMNADCPATIKIRAPKNFALNVTTGSGNTLIEGINGTISLKSGSGDIEYEGDTEALSGKSGSGKIELRGHAKRAELNSGSGDVDVTYIKEPTEGALEIKVGSGDVTVKLPNTTKVLSEMKSGSGDTKNDFGNTTNARFYVNLKAGSGDLSIRKL